MTKVQFLIFTLFLSFFYSCDKPEMNDAEKSIYCTTRSQNNIIITLTKSDNTIVSFSTTHAELNYINDNLFTVIVSNSPFASLNFTAKSLSADNTGSSMKVVKNPGANQIIYSNLTSLLTNSSTETKLQITADPDNLLINGTCIIIDESDSM